MKTVETKTQHVDGWGEKQPAMDKNADALGRWMSKLEALPTSSWISSKVPDTQVMGKPQSKNQASSCSMGKPNSKIASSSKQGIPKQVIESSNSSIMGKPKPETLFNKKYYLFTCNYYRTGSYILHKFYIYYNQFDFYQTDFAKLQIQKAVLDLLFFAVLL